MHKWKFTSHFRKSAFGWKGSRLAAKRVIEACKEIKKVSEKDLHLAAEGAKKLLVKLIPSIEQVDDSWGILGGAVNSLIEDLVKIIECAGKENLLTDDDISDIWNAYSDDGYSYLEPIGHYWGRICGTPEKAAVWAERLLLSHKEFIGEKKYPGFSNGTIPLLSSLLACKRYDELLHHLKSPNLQMWHYQIFGAEALAEQNKIDAAIEYAENCLNLFSPPVYSIYRFCEDLLLKTGRFEEAYNRYGLTEEDQKTNLNIYRSILKKYPAIGSDRILKDLIERTSDEHKGKWFATSKTLGKLDLAISLAKIGPTEPKTLTRAAVEYEVKNPEFALQCAQLSLKWLSEGHGYEITGFDIIEPYSIAKRVSAALGKQDDTLKEIHELVAKNNSRLKILATY
jgi:tetratricopeptide (TPR) repeat protein